MTLRPVARARATLALRMPVAGCLAATLISGSPDGTLAADAAPCPALPTIAQVIADDAGLRDTRGFEEERALRDFALFWYRNLASDLVDGRGPAVDVFVEAFRPACAQPEVLVEWLRELLVASGTGTDFSRRVAMARALALPRESSRSAR